MPPHHTNALEVFVKMVEAVRAGVTMTPRSASDKEYFFQDWFSARLTDLGLPFEQQGRNSYPDYWTGSTPVEGFEVKSLRFVNPRPARKDIDFNSTIPSGRKQGRDVFLVFGLYTGSGAKRPRRLVTPRADLGAETLAPASTTPAHVLAANCGPSS
jgi:hypothetical protein